MRHFELTLATGRVTVTDERWLLDCGTTSLPRRGVNANPRCGAFPASVGLVVARSRPVRNASGAVAARGPEQHSSLGATVCRPPETPGCVGGSPRSGAATQLERGFGEPGGKRFGAASGGTGLSSQHLECAAAPSLPERLSSRTRSFDRHVAAAVEGRRLRLETLPLRTGPGPGGGEKNAGFCGKYGLCLRPPRSWRRMKPTCCSFRRCARVGLCGAKPPRCLS